MSASKRFGTLKRTHRLDWIVATLREFGSKTANEIADKWNNVHVQPEHPMCHRRVTIDTIQRDVKLLVKQGRIEAFRSPTKGHEMGQRSWVAYTEYRHADV